MKVLLWEDDGFLLLYKRLEDGKFSWPRNEQEVRNITREQFICAGNHSSEESGDGCGRKNRRQTALSVWKAILRRMR